MFRTVDPATSQNNSPSGDTRYAAAVPTDGLHELPRDIALIDRTATLGHPLAAIRRAPTNDTTYAMQTPAMSIDMSMARAPSANPIVAQIDMQLMEQSQEVARERAALETRKAAQIDAARLKYNAASGSMVNETVALLREFKDEASKETGSVAWDTLGRHPLKQWAMQALQNRPELQKLLYHVNSHVSVSASGAPLFVDDPVCTRSIVSIDGSVSNKLKKDKNSIPIAVAAANSIELVAQLKGGPVLPEKIATLHSGDSMFLLLAAASRDEKGFANTGMNAVLCGLPVENVTYNGVVQVPAQGTCTSKGARNTVFYTDFVAFNTDIPTWDEAHSKLSGHLIASGLSDPLLAKVVAERIGDANPSHHGLPEKASQQVNEIHQSIQQCRAMIEFATEIGNGGHAATLVNSRNFMGPVINLMRIQQETAEYERDMAACREGLDKYTNMIEQIETDMQQLALDSPSDAGAGAAQNMARDSDNAARLALAKAEAQRCKLFLDALVVKHEAHIKQQERVRNLAQFFCMLWKFARVDEATISVYANGDAEAIRYVERHDSNNERDNAMIDRLSLPASKDAMMQLVTYAQNLMEMLRIEHDGILVANEMWVDDRDNNDSAHDADVRAAARTMCHPVHGNSILDLLNFHVAPSGIPLHQIKKLCGHDAFHNAFLHSTADEMATFEVSYLVLRVPLPKSDVPDGADMITRESVQGVSMKPVASKPGAVGKRSEMYRAPGFSYATTIPPMY